MKITDEQRVEAELAKPDYIKQLYASTETGALLQTTFQKYSLDETIYRNFALLIGDVILGLQQKAELSQLLVAELGTTADTATHIIIDLEPLFSQLTSDASQNSELVSESVPQQPTTPTSEQLGTVPVSEEEIRERLHLRPEGIVGDGLSPAPKPSSEHAPPSSVSRTMAHDIEVMQSPQPNDAAPTIPRFSKPLTDTPTYGDPDKG